MQAKNDLTKDEIEAVVAYDPESGIFRWKTFRGSSASKNIGAVAGRIAVNGHRQIVITGRRYYASRLAWVLVTGDWPKDQVDHINCNAADDRFANLRECTQSENMANARRAKNNTTGVKGVSYVRSQNGPNKFKATIKLNGKSHFIGWFPDLLSAYDARVRAANLLHGAFARHR